MNSRPSGDQKRCSTSPSRRRCGTVSLHHPDARPATRWAPALSRNAIFLSSLERVGNVPGPRIGNVSCLVVGPQSAITGESGTGSLAWRRRRSDCRHATTWEGHRTKLGPLRSSYG